MSSLVREPCRTSLLGGVGVGVGVGFAVGRGVGRAVGRAVGFAVGRAVGTGDGVAVAPGVGLRRGDAVGAGPDGNGVRAGVGAWVGTDALGDGAGDREPGAAGPQLATTRAAARAILAMALCTSESRSIT
jgi:hypothetical protein